MSSKRRRGGKIGQSVRSEDGADLVTQSDSVQLKEDIVPPPSNTSHINDEPDPIIPVFAESVDKSDNEIGLKTELTIEIDQDGLVSPYPDDAYMDAKRKGKPAGNIQRDHLGSVDISERSGNYLISVGLPSSGKTVLQSFLTYYLTTTGKFDARLDSKEISGKINYEAQRLQTLWLEEWTHGRFPKGTPLDESEIREIRLNITYQENKRQKFNFSFLEISGENFKDVVPTERSDPTLFTRIRSFLTNKNINFNIAFVLKTDENPDEPSNDALFTNFISFIENELSVDLQKKIGLILVIPNPKQVFGGDAWKRIRSNKPSDRKFYEKIAKDFVYENFKATYMIYDRWNPKKRAITVFHIGEEEGGILKSKDTLDARSFVNLNYRFFTGSNFQPKKSILKRIFRL